ncbi:VOC family protein [Sediminivirga luteola]|uniref:VOC family protein n=1 Tax=Sediminivirga luteola TaxID=1774748 RepID=UPI001F57E7BC|nr:VOC family protein [Sediminivirga luteola]MCI2265548.1 VOC family protein [Sediminivirga luteola]
MNITQRIIVLDAADIDAESRFWASVLGGTVDAADDDWHRVHAGGEYVLAVQLAPDHVPPQWPEGTPPQQIHLDLHVDDIGAAHEEVLAAGATLLKRGSEDERFHVYADPAGHPFCLCW